MAMLPNYVLPHQHTFPPPKQIKIFGRENAKGRLRNSRRMKYLIFGFVLVIVPDLLGVTSFSPGPWKSGHATFYENANGGACGYDNPSTNGYGTATTAVSTPLFSNGKACGQCFQLKCSGSKWCFPFVPSITVTATNLCPPNWYQASNAGGWCNPPNLHFDLAKPSFMRFAFWKAGIVPVKFRRVPCSRKGGIRFRFQGNPNWLLVYVMNVGGSGDVANMWVKGTKTGWIKMSQNWGAAFQAFSMLGGQSLSFKIQSGSSQTIIANNVTPQYWSGGQTYQASVNFK